MVYPNDYLGPLYGQPVDGHDRCPGEGMSECVCMRARWHSIWHSINLRGRYVRALSNATLHVSPERQDVAQMRHAFPIIYPSIYPCKTKDRPSLSISLSLHPSFLPGLWRPLVFDPLSPTDRSSSARENFNPWVLHHTILEGINRRPNRANEQASLASPSWPDSSCNGDRGQRSSRVYTHPLSLSSPFFHFCFWRSFNRIQSVEIPIHRFFLCVLFFFLFFFSNVYADSSVFPF